MYILYIYIYNPQWFNTSLPSHRFWRSRASRVQVTASEHVSLDFEKEPDLDEAPKSPQFDGRSPIENTTAVSSLFDETLCIFMP